MSLDSSFHANGLEENIHEKMKRRGYKNNFEKKSKLEFPYDAAIPLLGIYSKN